MSAGERRAAWVAAASGSCDIVIGPRSAVFAPLSSLGLVVVDEEHESAYKQYDAAPRYHARDVAVVRARNARATVILGSATPSLESYANATAGKYHLLELPARIDDARMPEITIVDMIRERKALYAATKESLPAERRHELKHFRQPLLSQLLRESITDRLARKEGIILLQNRRGYAPFLECLDCGHTETCDNCSVTMTYHAAQRHLRCHYCGAVKNPPLLCPDCGSPELQLQGAGTQRIEEELTNTFPQARIERMDLDTTTRKGSHDRILRRFGERTTDILLGTQMVAKGLDYPHVTLVGVISADTQLLLPDFRASERTYQLLTQVAGRAGRSTLKGEVIVQTHQADHPTLRHVVSHSYEEFYREEAATRAELQYPPFARLVLIELRGPDALAVEKDARSLARRLNGTNGWFTVLGPAPAVIARIRNNYRWHILIKYGREQDPSGARMSSLLRTLLERAMQAHTQVRVAVDVDPVGLL
jgi:primosomal protein N' (replication factor Y)